MLSEVVINEKFISFVKEVEKDRDIAVTDGFICIPFHEELLDIVEEYVRCSEGKPSSLRSEQDE